MLKRGEGMNDTVERITLKVKELVISQLADLDHQNLEIDIRYRADMLAHQISAFLRVPVDVFSDQRLVVEYPANWWQAIRARLGWKHKTTVVRLTEWLMYPKLGVPDWAKEQGVLAVHYVKAEQFTANPWEEG